MLSGGKAAGGEKYFKVVLNLKQLIYTRQLGKKVIMYMAMVH